jgi:hypothetical protein
MYMYIICILVIPIRGHSQRLSEQRGGREVWEIRTNSDIGGDDGGFEQSGCPKFKKIQKQISFSSILNSPSHCEIGILTMRLILDFVLINNLYVFVFTFIVGGCPGGGGGGGRH